MLTRPSLCDTPYANSVNLTGRVCIPIPPGAPVAASKKISVWIGGVIHALCAVTVCRHTTDHTIRANRQRAAPLTAGSRVTVRTHYESTQSRRRRRPLGKATAVAFSTASRWVVSISMTRSFLPARCIVKISDNWLAVRPCAGPVELSCVRRCPLPAQLMTASSTLCAPDTQAFWRFV